MPVSLLEIENKSKELLYLDDDPLIVKIVISSFLGNLIEGAPTWVLLVGESGSGKTTLLEMFGTSQRAHLISSMNSTSFLTFANKDESLLYQADGKVLIVRDMSTVLSGQKDEKGVLYSALREVYDGNYRRTTGKGTIEWTGKIGFLGGVTPVIETYGEFQGALGERFIQVRLKSQPDDKILRKMLRGMGSSTKIRNQLQSMTAEFVDQHVFTPSAPNPDLESIVMVSAMCIAQCRTPVFRDRYTKDVVFPTGRTEVPTRVAGMLMRICLVALDIGILFQDVVSILKRFVRDNIPMTRFRILKPIADQGGELLVRDVIKTTGMSGSVSSRILEDLVGVGVLNDVGNTKRRISNKWLLECLTTA